MLLSPLLEPLVEAGLFLTAATNPHHSFSPSARFSASVCESSIVILATRLRVQPPSASRSSSQSACRITSSGVVGGSRRSATIATANPCVCGLSQSPRSSTDAPLFTSRLQVPPHAARSARTHASIGSSPSRRSRIQPSSVGTASASRSTAATLST